MDALSTAQARNVCVRSLELMASGAPPDFAAFYHEQARNREALREPPDSRGQGPGAFLASAQWLRNAYADLSWQVLDVAGEGDLVVVHATMSGRHVGPFTIYGDTGSPVQVFPPTGRTFTVTQTHWFRLRDGLIFEHWANRDDKDQAVQLGWVQPSPAYLLRMRRALRAARREHTAAGSASG